MPEGGVLKIQCVGTHTMVTTAESAVTRHAVGWQAWPWKTTGP